MTVDGFNDIECFFFDLDGTLLDISDEIFGEEYMKLVAGYFEDIITPDLFLKYFMTAVEALMKHSNYQNFAIESFLPKFSELSGVDKDEAWRRLEEFYSNDFGELQQYAGDSSVSKSLIRSIQSKGKKILLATNPIFPEIATRQRVEWAGLDYEKDFIFVPDIHNSNALKPDPKYYHNLMELVDVPAEKILMIGNDYLFDGSASQVGIKTWIIDKNILNLEYKTKFQIDYEGSLQELTDRVNSMS